MSLIYKLFGIPKTLEEFVDKVKKDKGTKIEIGVERYPSIWYALHPLYYSTVVLKHRKDKLSLVKIPDYAMIHYEEITLQLARNVEEAQEKIKNLSLEVETNFKI